MYFHFEILSMAYATAAVLIYSSFSLFVFSLFILSFIRIQNLVELVECS